MLTLYESHVKIYKFPKYGAYLQEYNLLFSAKNTLPRAKVTITKITFYILKIMLINQHNIKLYVLVMSRSRFRVDPNSIVA